MNKKFKLALIALIPSLIIFVVFIVFVLFYKIIDLIAFLPLVLIIIPYNIAIVAEISLKQDGERDILSEHELNLIQEQANIVKSLEMIIVSFSFLFGLFTAIEFDLQIAGVPSSQLIRLFGMPFGADFFMSTFVFIQVQVLGKDAYLTNTEIEKLTIGFKKTNKIKNLVTKLHLANFTRKGCYYSLLIQICLIYPVVMSIVGI